MLGKILGGRYSILEQIGGGGMSIVYKARDIYLNRAVAIKILREQLTNDQEFVARFNKEAQAVASLSHVNIVGIYDVGKDDSIYYLVMEMIEGRNLKDYIRENGPLPIAQAVDIMQQLCDALQHAHSHKIIHCDIKPHNIILSKEGIVKVTDFGIARAVTTATVTNTGSIMGSVHYFSPEQAKGDIADEKSDIYSTGVVLYELLTGKLPFEGETPIGVALKKISSSFIAPREYNPDINEALEKVILRAMDRNPFKRYESAADLKKDIVSAYTNNELEPSLSKSRLNWFPGKTKQNEKTKGYFSKWMTGGIIGISLLGILLGYFITSRLVANSEISIPNIVGMDLLQAEKLLDEMELIITTSKEENHPMIEKGLIISQEPEAQMIVKKGSAISVVLSEGPIMVKVPNILNMSMINAQEKLAEDGLNLGEVTRVYHEQILSGRVVHQEPAEGKELMQGSAINIIESKGPEPIWVSMPLLIGMNIDQARIVLQNNKFTVGIVQTETNSEYQAGIVLRQDPGTNSEILQGSAVNLVISAGSDPTGVNDQ